MRESNEGPNGEWRPDPFGRFEFRRFLFGRPTSLVKNGDTEGYDQIETWIAEAREPQQGPPLPPFSPAPSTQAPGAAPPPPPPPPPPPSPPPPDTWPPPSSL